MRLAWGRRCPYCGRGTNRLRTPPWARPLRALSLHHCSQRICPGCGWSGLAFHRRSRRAEQAPGDQTGVSS